MPRRGHNKPTVNHREDISGTGGQRENVVGTPGYAVSALRAILDNPEANAPAKASAARTLAEIEGRIGRHQQAPIDRTGDRPVSALSRVELERELARLRTVCGGDTALTP